jgi:hypothetical protein
MPQLRVYRSFIKKAADMGKYLIIWDEKRRYEGKFKGFDPQGEFVILVDVLIKDENEEIESPEVLIPIENIKIVSTETEEERRKRLASQREIQTGLLMPGVKPETVTSIPVAAPEVIKVEENVLKEQAEEKYKEKPAAIEPQEIKEPEKPAQVEDKFEQKIEEVESIPKTVSTKTSEKEEQPEKEDTLVSVLESDVDTSILSQETKELIEELSRKAAARAVTETKEQVDQEVTASPLPKVEVLEEKTSPKIVIPEVELKPETTISEKTVPPAQSAPKPAAESKVETKSEPAVTKKTATAIIEEKSKKAAASRIFAEQKTKKPEIPKRKVDIATLILDILIVILGIVAIGILAVTFLGIKLPF